jgi:predicted transglutaminase-like cysteine proteinase
LTERLLHLSSRYIALQGWRWLLCGLLLLCLGLSRAEFTYSDKALKTMQTRFGSDGVAILGAWQTLVNTGLSQSDAEKLKLANDFFNHNIRFQDDITYWKEKDYWATPLETLGARLGDCEDYTIAKYITLIHMGIPMERLRLIYVRAQIGGTYSKISQAHMVLGYYDSPNAMPQVLDNLVSRIQPATERTDLKPVFSFNSKGLWVGSSAQSQADPTARLSRWRDLLARMQAEGFYE